MSTKAICNITVLALDNWAEPVQWPPRRQFYAACVIDKVSKDIRDGGMDPYELMGVAMAAGARSIFWWGTGKKEDDVLHMTIEGSDSSVFTYAYRVAMGEMEKDENMLSYPCSDPYAWMAVDEMVDCVEERSRNDTFVPTLIIIGIKGSLSMKKILVGMKNTEKHLSMDNRVYKVLNKSRGKSCTIEVREKG